MMRWALLPVLCAAPVMAPAAARDLSPLAGYCVEALVESRPLLTSAMHVVTAEAAGRPEADPRTEFFSVPWEQLFISRIIMSGYRGCVSFLEDGQNGWTISSVTDHMTAFGLVRASQCDGDEAQFWFLPQANPAGRGVTAVSQLAGDVVQEILAFETPTPTNPEKCAQGQTQ